MHPLFTGLDPVRTIRILASERKIDLIVSVFESSCLLLLLLRDFVRFRPPIAILDSVLTESWAIRRRIQNIALARADHLLLLSSGQQAYIDQHWSNHGRIQIIWQHVDTNFYTPVQPNPDGPILSVGEDVGRDFPTLVNAIHDLDVDLILKTKQEVEIDPSARSRIRKISERLSFLQLRKLYASCRFVVVPLHETLNVIGVGTVLEAMAMGKALIVSDNPPIRDYIIPDETCLVVPPGDVAALRSAIERLIREPETVRRLGAAGRKLAEARFSHPVHAARLGAAFRLASGVADPSPGRRPGRHDPVEQNP